MALEAYLELARQGCELLTGIDEVPVPEDKRNEILSQRREELHAHSEYTKARSKLWEFLNDSKPRLYHLSHPSFGRAVA